jgi:alkylation response protein AidB-like acyl-CoA dehydrogenase
MITNPLTADDEIEIEDMVRTYCRATFTSARVREASASVTGTDDVAWKQMVELGWSGLGIDTELGGAGLGLVAQCIAVRELGARLAPTPYLASAAFAVAALTTLSGTERGNELLGCIATDPLATMTLALGSGHGWDVRSVRPTTARAVGDGWVLDGVATLVPDASRARTVLVIAALDAGTRWGLFEVDNRDGQLTTPTSIVDGTRQYADVVLNAAPAIALHSEDIAWDGVQRLIDRLVVCLAAELVGVGIACLTQTLGYLRTRHQFGRPIGSFQALKHRCADLAVDLTTAQELVFAAAAMSDRPDALAVFAPLALARTQDVAKRSAEEAIQMHGGVGFTEEYDLGMLYRRTIADIELIASPSDAYARLYQVRSGRTT